MHLRSRVSTLVFLALLAFLPVPPVASAQPAKNAQGNPESAISATQVSEPAANPRAVLVAPGNLQRERLVTFREQGINTVVFLVDPLQNTDLRIADLRMKTQWANESNLAVGYWIEVARSPELADQHPEWMASLQTHDEWRRFFPESPKPKPSEVTKTYPWVPILSRETFEAQQKRIIKLVQPLPPAQFIFLNDLQGAPSACGCGNDLCRWTSDYGDRRSTIPLDDNAAANFAIRIQAAFPKSKIVPIWATECEEQDGHSNGQCAGVGCFKGICWKAYTKQLMPLSQICDQIGVLALETTFKRKPPSQGNYRSWLEYAAETFQTMPALHNETAIPNERLITVIEGYETRDEDLFEVTKSCQELGVAGVIIALDEIDQSWSPKIVRWKDEP